MEEIKKFFSKVNSLNLRERGLIMLGICFVLFTVWNSFFMKPQEKREKQVLSELQLKRAEQTALNFKFQKLMIQSRQNIDVENRKKLVALKQELEEVEHEINESTAHLVSPKNMSGILETILNKSKALELIGIKGLGVTPLMGKVNTGAKPDSPETDAGKETSHSAGDLANAYKHGLVITFEGDYMSTLQYARELEGLEWGFFWDSIEYEVIGYPRGRITLTLYTLSLDRNWIGV